MPAAKFFYGGTHEPPYTPIYALYNISFLGQFIVLLWYLFL